MNKLSSTVASAPFHTALLLVRHEDHAVVDKRALRDVGIRNIRVLTSGVEAARILQESLQQAGDIVPRFGSPELVFCHEQLADMTGDEFIRLIRLHPGLLSFPAVMAVTSDTQTIRAKAHESGYSGLLARPYPQKALTIQLQHAAAHRDATPTDTSTDTSAFESALAYFISQDAANSQDAGKVFRSGLLTLRQQRWDESINTLQRASRLNPDEGKILVALAAAWRGKKNPDKSTAMLQEAVAVFAQKKDWAQAVAVSQRLVREHPGIPYPLHGETRRLLAAGKYKDAAEALLCDESMLDVSNTGRNGLCEQLRRACLATANPEETLSAFCTCLAEAGQVRLGNILQASVLERMTQESSSERDSFDMSLCIDQPSSIELASEQRSSGASSEVLDLWNPTTPAALTLETPLPSSQQTPSVKKNSSSHQSSSPQVIALLNEPSAPSALKGFPRLSDALVVAKVTLGLFKAHKKR